MNTPHQRLLTENETAEYLQIKPNTLATWRSTKRYRLPFIRVGRVVRYRVEDLERFLTERTVGSEE
jgi:excisionase family DNA binding protein